MCLESRILPKSKTLLKHFFWGTLKPEGIHLIYIYIYNTLWIKLCISSYANEQGQPTFPPDVISRNANLCMYWFRPRVAKHRSQFVVKTIKTVLFIQMLNLNHDWISLLVFLLPDICIKCYHVNCVIISLKKRNTHTPL